MLDQILHDINNYFVLKKYRGEYTISNGRLELPFLLNDQYFRINGSVFNDGVYIYPAESLKDEVFRGEIWAMAVPPEFLDLVADIENWQASYGDVILSPYSSESFGGYTYSKAVGGGRYDSGDGGNSGWQKTFSSRLNRWRKI